MTKMEIILSIILGLFVLWGVVRDINIQRFTSYCWSRQGTIRVTSYFAIPGIYSEEQDQCDIPKKNQKLK